MTRAQVTGVVLLITPVIVLWLTALVEIARERGWGFVLVVVATLVSMVTGAVLIGGGAA